MKNIRKPGVTRRPLEYVLLAVVCLLIAVLLWSNYSLRQAGKSYTASAVMGASNTSNMLDIGTVTEADSVGEYRTAGKIIRTQNALFDDSDQAFIEISDEYYANLSDINSCASLTDSFSTSINKLNDKINNFYIELDDDLGDSDELSNQYDLELSEWRTTQDNNRRASYASHGSDDIDLSSKFYQLDAVTQERRNSFDTLRNTYMSNIRQAYEAKASILRSGVDKFASDLGSAVLRAQSICRNTDGLDSINPNTQISADFTDLGNSLADSSQALAEYKNSLAVSSKAFKSGAKKNLSDFQAKYYELGLPSAN